MDFIKNDKSRRLYRNYENLIKSLVGKKYILSKFLDPYEQNLLKSLLNKHQLYYKIFKTHPLAERALIIFSRNQIESLELALAEVTCLVIENPHPNIKHPDVLGAIMSLSIDRENVGDILVSEDKIEISVLRDVADYIRFNINQINKHPVKLIDKNSPYLDEAMLKFEDKIVSLSSPRLDNFVSAAINLSRSKAQTIIKAEKVKLNHVRTKNPANQVNVGDAISIRGYGRFYYEKFVTKTKKEKDRICIRKII